MDDLLTTSKSGWPGKADDFVPILIKHTANLPGLKRKAASLGRMTGDFARLRFADDGMTFPLWRSLIVKLCKAPNLRWANVVVVSELVNGSRAEEAMDEAALH